MLSRRLFIAVSLTVLFASFAFNIFGVGVDTEWFHRFDTTSANIIKKTTACKAQQDYYSGPIMVRPALKDKTELSNIACTPDQTIAYTSIFGLQARVINFFAPAKPDLADRYIKKVELGLALLSAILLTLFIVRIRDQYSEMTSFVVLFLVAISPWIVGYSRHLYWVLPALFAPFIFAYLYYDKLRSHRQQVLFYLVILALFMLKMLNGYEHITTMVFSVFAVIVYYDYKNSKHLIRKLIRPILITSAVAIVAFAGALSLHVVGLNEIFGDTEKSLSSISDRAVARSGDKSSLEYTQPHTINVLNGTLPEIYRAIDYYKDLDVMAEGGSSSLTYALISAINYALLPAINLPVNIKGVFGIFIQSIVFFAILGFIVIRKLGRKYKNLGWATATGLAGALSWLILMPSHAYPHAFLNGIIFYLPFLLFVYIALGEWINLTFKKRLRKYAKKKR